MNPERLIGKTLGELAPQTGVFWRPIHVFLLESESDDTGKRLIDAYSLHQVIAAHPAAATATIISAYDYYGDIVIRIRT